MASRRRRGRPRSFVVPEKTSDRRAYERMRLPVLPATPTEITEAQVQRPRTREDCRNVPRPCPWVGCKHHLYLEVTSTGGLKINFPDLEPWEIAETCSLDVAERGGITLEAIGGITNLTRERVRQIEVRGLLVLKFDKLKGAA